MHVIAFRLFDALHSRAVQIDKQNLEARVVELGGSGETQPVGAPEWLLPVAYTREHSFVRTARRREAQPEALCPGISGERQCGAVWRPPRLAALAGPIGDLPAIRAVRQTRPEIEAIAALARKVGDPVGDDQLGPKLQAVESEIGVMV